MTDADGVNFRKQIRRAADEHDDLTVEDLLIQSKSRDPMWKGTDHHHRKARWFAQFWREVVSNRPGDSVHPRGVHYYLIHTLDRDVSPPTDQCSWSSYRNTLKCYNYLNDASILARVLTDERGDPYVPLDGIQDNKHDQTTVTEYGSHAAAPAVADLSSLPDGVSRPPIPLVDSRATLEFDPDGDDPPGWPDVAEFVADELGDGLGDDLHFNRARQSAFHVELWCEKGIPDWAKQTAREHGVNVVVEGEGDLSYSVAGDFASRVNKAGKPGVVLYLSDFDQDGDRMAASMAGKLSWLEQRGALDERVVVKQLAVTREQIEAHDLPRVPIEESEYTGAGAKSYETKVSRWEERKGSGRVELQALWNEYDIFENILTSGLSAVIDEQLPSKNRKAVRQWRDDVHEAVRDAVSTSDLGERLPELLEWVGEFNDELEDAAETIRGLRQMVDEGPYAEWQASVRDTLDDVDLPEAEPPEGEAALPPDPIYDSDRDRVDNLLTVRDHKHGERDAESLDANGGEQT